MRGNIFSLFRKIDDVQNQVAGLSDILDSANAENASEAEFLKKTYGLRPRQCQRLGVMILKLQDNDLPERGVRRLDKWLALQTGAMRYFIDFQHSTSMLRLMFHPDLMDVASCSL